MQLDSNLSKTDVNDEVAVSVGCWGGGEARVAYMRGVTHHNLGPVRLLLPGQHQPHAEEGSAVHLLSHPESMFRYDSEQSTH